MEITSICHFELRGILFLINQLSAVAMSFFFFEKFILSSGM
jgi:hypothetical protein